MNDVTNDAVNTSADTTAQIVTPNAEPVNAEPANAERDIAPAPESAGDDAFTHVDPLLELRRVTTHYGPIRVLHNVDMVIYPGEMVCLLGGNASGKSTTLKTILGVVRVTEGELRFRGERADNLTIAERIQHGMAVVPENRRIFPKMTVRENLEMGAYLRNDRAAIREDMDYVFTLFPRLSERIDQLGGTMSGGEQQMLAMGRALMSRPKLILMDEPSMGLAPLFVERIFEIIKQVNERGISVFVVEQNANVALSIADRGYVLQTGEVVLSGPAQDLLHNEAMKRAYLGEV
jgi:branched-chain amino acid transport system ATP-binding protein